MTQTSPLARYTLLAVLCYLRSQEITDNLVDLLIQLVHRIGARAEKRVESRKSPKLEEFSQRRYEGGEGVTGRRSASRVAVSGSCATR